MATLYCFGCVVFLVASSVTISVYSTPESKCGCPHASFTRKHFPPGFIFGAASSAYQIEGAYNESGKGTSMWDYFTHTYPEKISDSSNGDVAVDSYHLYKEDVLLARKMGLDAYRFSISWPRILPGGKIKEGVNQDGIRYYNNLINELIANGINPVVTIFHFDTPQALEEAYGGFLNAEIVKDYVAFANLLFEQFGDRVKYWITLNEPGLFSQLGYALGGFAPGRCSDWQGGNCTGGDSATEPYTVSHNQLLAHAAAVQLYKKKYQAKQKGKIGITLVSDWIEPYDHTSENQKAKARALDFTLGWFMEPLTFGSYPDSMRVRVGSRLPEFSAEEMKMVKGSFDFIGLNYYSARYAYNSPNTSSFSHLTDSETVTTGEKNGNPIGQQGTNLTGMYIQPRGLREILGHIKQSYNNPVIYITENGLGEARNDSLPISQALNDNMRKHYIHDHICCLHEAIQKYGVNVKGYFAWSLMDNFEWSRGYSVRFGLHYVDYNDKRLPRYPKRSALWYKKFLAA